MFWKCYIIRGAKFGVIEDYRTLVVWPCLTTKHQPASCSLPPEADGGENQKSKKSEKTLRAEIKAVQ